VIVSRKHSACCKHLASAGCWRDVHSKKVLVVWFTRCSADITGAAEYHIATEMAPRITDCKSLLELKKTL
jgi:hypothetical protein